MEIRHIGMINALCDGRKRAYLRDDLGEERYRQLGLKERFVGEAKYRICRKCIAALSTRFKRKKHDR